MARLEQQFHPKRAVSTLAASFLFAGTLAAKASGRPRSGLAGQTSSRNVSTCPSASELDHLLSVASQSMQHEQYEAAVSILEPSPLPKCDARIDLLLGAAFEGSGHSSAAQRLLDEAHRRWPSNYSVAASLARSRWLAGRASQAAEALASTPIIPGTPVQELELRAEVYLSVHQLALEAAAAAYRTHPDTKTLLLLANVMQIQGRAQDALRLLEGGREQNASSLPFLITIASPPRSHE